MEIRRLRPEKDDSDTQSAVCLAVEKGAREILLLGATGSRLDHMLANIGLLAMGKERGVHISIADANNYMMLAEDGMVLEKEQQFGKYVFFPSGRRGDGTYSGRIQVSASRPSSESLGQRTDGQQ